MLEFFTIFSKSGIVLFTTVKQSINDVVNGLIQHVFLEGRTGSFQTEHLQIKYHLDNEFELVFVIGYQKFLQLCYVDKFLDTMQLEFRDKYPDFDLAKILNQSFEKHSEDIIKFKNSNYNSISNYVKNDNLNPPNVSKHLDFCDLEIDENVNILDLTSLFSKIYKDSVKKYGSEKRSEPMRTFQDSAKSKKTIGSMIVQPDKPAPKQVEKVPEKIPQPPQIAQIRKFAKPKSKSGESKKAASDASKKKGKAARQWELSNSNAEELDFSKKLDNDKVPAEKQGSESEVDGKASSQVLNLQDVQTDLNMSELESSDEEDEEENEQENEATASKGKGYFSSIWKSISYNKVLSDDDLRPVLNQLREHLTSKNVAAQIAEDICNNVGEKLKGIQVNTWMNLKKFARNSLEETVLRILNSGNNINILREVQSKKDSPYMIVLCGVNGVGKSTNLAKIANWLIINNIKVLVVAGDTFRAGAIEQLKTHVRALKSLHERVKKATGADVKIELYEKGYSRDPDHIVRSAVEYAKVSGFNCIIVDTAGRMQDNEPLMKQLAKLIKNNQPDLTLFVGEALVGNEAVDQLTKFNNSLVDNGCQLADSSRSAINGIVLTKFDTIDDQVGAAISMTYVTGKPIVFVGVGQNYRDLKQLDARAVTRALMR